MKFHCLSNNPNKACSILKFRGTTLMFDCGLDIASALNFLPLPLVPSSRLQSLSTWSPRDPSSSQVEGELKECGGRVFVDSCLEFCMPEKGIVDFSEIDVILISNYQVMMALPYITEETGFRGVVYATEPTLHIGRQFMEEIVTYIERTPKPFTAKKWKQPDITKLLPPPLCDVHKPQSWRSTFSMKDVNSSLAKVKVVGYGEQLDIFGAFQISSVSSGYCLGSCNWIIQSDHEKIVYVSASSTLTTHPKPLEHTPLRNSNALILSCLTQTPQVNPDSMLGEFCITISHTVKNGGNVLVPCYPSGVTYDLFECLALHLETTGPMNVPMFFVSPVAEHSLAYSNILAEWLSQGKQSKVYVPEEPFPHAQLIRSGRLKHFSNLREGFSNEFRTPCIVFTGHPSLRFGDVVHFIELWGNSSNNAIVFTEPDFPYLEALAPYQPLSMKTMYYPIDTSLSFNQANKLIRDLKPNHLIVPDVYVNSQAGHFDLSIEADCPILTYKLGTILNIPVKRQLKKIEMEPELSEKLVPMEVKPGLALATVTGTLTVKDNKYLLKASSSSNKRPLDDDTAPFPTKYTWGSLDVHHFVQKLDEAGFNDVKVEEGSTGYIVHLPNEDSLIQVEEHSTHIICESDSQLRVKLKDILLQCLNKF